jgi:hypothetical protein
VCVGDSRWDATLGCRWRRSLRRGVGCMRQPIGRSLDGGSCWDVTGRCVGRWCWDGTLGCRRKRVLGCNAKWMRGPVSHSGCIQSLGRVRVYMGDSRWKAMLGCRRRQLLGLWMDKTECRPFFGCEQLPGCDREICGS